jgi:hypothetical protein
MEIGKFLPKLKIIERENFDDISDLKEEFKDYDIFFCTLGSLAK